MSSLRRIIVLLGIQVITLTRKAFKLYCTFRLCEVEITRQKSVGSAVLESKYFKYLLASILKELANN